ncbi:MAG: Hsp20/alpha crystallin family protein, partial [Patescibacteria group bacterium]
ELASEPANPEFELAKATSVAQPKLKIKKAVEEDEMEPEGQLTIDVYQTPSEIVIESAVAGVEPDDIDINVTNDSVTIKGRRRRAREVKDEDYFYQECYWGRFSRSVILPQEVDPEGSYVNFKNGILSVHLPKLNRKKARKLRVKLE